MLIRRLLMLWRIIQAGARNFLRNAWLSIAATSVMVITLTVMLGAVIFNMALGATLDGITESIDVAIFFTDAASEEQIQTFRSELEQNDNVESVNFVSKAEALERYRERYADNPDLLAAIGGGENPLPRSLEIELHNLQQVDEVLSLQDDPRFADVIDRDRQEERENSNTIQSIADAKQFLLQFGIVTSLIFASISILIIFNTIRIAIFSRAHEIEIMRLVGATNGFIRGPFLFEAMLNGIIAAGISLGLIYLALTKGIQGLISYDIDFTSTLEFFFGMWPLVVLLTLAAGMLIGIISSLLAMVRYLKL